MRTRLKVCCIASEAEARTAISLGADALGLVAEMPSGPGPIPDVHIARIASAVPPPLSTFLLTSRTEPDAIIEHHALCRTTTIQLVDHLEPDEHAHLRTALPGVRLVQVIHVTDDASVDEAIDAAQHCHALLLDSGNPKLAVKELGGTGRTHDWTLSRTIVERAPIPVFLAGGINPSNVADAIRAVRPFGIDLCSGVRTNGALNPDKLAALVKAMATADA